jgi:ubiquinone/menaquinone biosynthesis C-methylase UbiE
MADLRDLFERDWRNIDDGLYGLPHDLVPRPYSGVRQSLRFFGDLAAVHRRRRAGANQEVFDGPYRNKRPRYYLQNFHDQSGGYLSEASAQLYDYQVEVLFSGGADAMRRQALPPITRFLRSRNVRSCRLLDIACGTGRFLSFVKDTHPRLSVTGLDLSGEYLAKASDNLRPWSHAGCLLANAEDMPLADSSFDIVTCHYLFHEVPAQVRRRIAQEIARVARPDALILFVDSIQPGDEPAYDGLLERFPCSFHEPYFLDYMRENLETLFAKAGLDTESVTRAFFSRVMVLHPRPKRRKRPKPRRSV